MIQMAIKSFRVLLPQTRLSLCLPIIALTHVETVCLLSRKNVKEHLFVDVETTDLKKEQLPIKPTYKQLQAYIEAKHGFKVTPLYIAQVKDKLGLEKQYSFVDCGVAAEKIILPIEKLTLK